MSKKIPDKWLYIPIILLGVYFFIRLVDQSKLIYTFPFDFANDLPAYIASLFFLAECGFNKLCPYWYNGFISFKTFSPGWQFFTYPIYKLFKNILFSAYVSIVLMYVLSFLFIFILGKNEKFSIAKRVAFFLFFFTNAINVGDFFKLGRVVSLFGFCMFLGMSVFIFYYRKKRIDKKFILFIPVYGFAILSHPQEAVLFNILIFSLFLSKKNIYELKMIFLSIVISFLLTSFWWAPFILNLSEGGTILQRSHQGAWLWATSGPFLWDSIAAFFVSLIFFITFYYYWLSKNKSKEELLFFSPIILLNTLFFFRITPLIPVLKNISPDPYMAFFIFFIIYFFMNINVRSLGKLGKLVPYVLVLIVLISLSISHFKTPYFVEHTSVNEDTLDVLKLVDDKFLFLGSYENSYSLIYYCYAPIYLNLSTPDGYYYYIVPKEYSSTIRNIDEYLNNGDCETFIEKAKFFNVTNFISYGDECKDLENCNFKKIKEKGSVCLYKLNLSLNAS